MCGLVAIIDHSTQRFFQEDVESFWTMLLLNSLRGEHSTGVVGVRKDGRAEYIKVPGNPYNLETWKDFDEYKKRMVQNYTSVVGHGRFATKGAISCKNAHPFKRGDITLVHNGTLTNFEVLKKLYKNGDIFEVDSDICAQLFHNYTVKEVLEKIYGAFAFIWHDQKDNKIRAVRNLDRPLWMFKRTDKHKYYLASDKSIFSWLKDKYKMFGEIEEIEAGTLYTFDNKTNGEVKKEKVDVNFTPVTYYGGGKHYDEDYYAIPRNISHSPPKAASNVAAFTKKSVEKYSKGNIELSINQLIKFNPTDFKPHIRNGHIEADSHTILGTMIDVDGPIEVAGVYNGKIEDIFDAEVLTAMIRTIIVLPESDKSLCRVVVYGIRPLKETIEHPEKETTVSKEDEGVNVTLFDKSVISLKGFLTYTKGGCEFCGNVITSAQAPFVLIDGLKAYCPDCVVKGKYTVN